MTEPCFLVVRLGSLGDIVHTFPAVAALRESFPRAEIVWLTHPRWRELVESSALVSEIWETETRSLASVRDILARIRKKKFTAAIDYQGLWKSAVLPFLGRVPRRLGFSWHAVREFGVPLLYTERIRSTKIHIADQNGELSRRAGAGNSVALLSLTVPLKFNDAVHTVLKRNRIDTYVVLSPGGGWSSKCWPPERYGELCREINRSLGLRCIINHGPGEEARLSRVKAASGDSDPLIYNGTLGALMALLRNALCVVGGDTGPLHLAVALGTPVVALFGPTDPARNGPYRPGARSAKDLVLRSRNAVTTYKRGDQPDASLLDLPVAIENVDRNEDHPELDAGEEEIDQLDAVGKMDAEPVAFLKTSRAQRVGDAVTAALDFAEREFFSFPFERHLVAPAGERQIEELEQIHTVSVCDTL